MMIKIEDNPNGILDTILKQLKNVTDHIAQRPFEIYTAKQLEEICDRDRTTILEKLKKDGFINNENMNATVNKDYPHEHVGWYITFEGVLFLHAGGYTGKEQTDQAQADFLKAETVRVNNNEKALLRLAKSNYCLTVILVASSVIAAIYYSVELYCTVSSHSHHESTIAKSSQQGKIAYPIIRNKLPSKLEEKHQPIDNSKTAK